MSVKKNLNVIIITFLLSFSLLILPLRSDQIVYPFSTMPAYISRCLKWEKQTDFSYTYLIYKGTYFTDQICSYYVIKIFKH